MTRYAIAGDDIGYYNVSSGLWNSYEGATLFVRKRDAIALAKRLNRSDNWWKGRVRVTHVDCTETNEKVWPE